MRITPRQRQVVRLTSLGCTVREVAKIVDVTYGAVIVLKSRAMQELGVNNVTLMTRVALQHGIISMMDRLSPAEKSCCESPAQGSRHRPTTELTEKESQVVRLTSLGCTKDEAAAILKVAPSAVDTRKMRAMAKLDVNKVALLTRLAIKHGISSMSDKLTRAEKKASGRKGDGWN
jgi:DNA-binding CsgD family transcriptional regulator